MTMTSKEKTRIIWITAGMLIVGLFLGWLFFGGSGKDEHAEHLVEAIDEETTWTCSMHPQVRQSEPGDCPK